MVFVPRYHAEGDSAGAPEYFFSPRGHLENDSVGAPIKKNIAATKYFSGNYPFKRQSQVGRCGRDRLCRKNPKVCYQWQVGRPSVETELDRVKNMSIFEVLATPCFFEFSDRRASLFSLSLSLSLSLPKP